MSVKPCWNPDVLDWEGDLTGQHHGRSTPRGDLGFPVTLEADPAGFHFSLRVEFRDEQARQKFHRDLLRDAFAKFPRAQVPGERKMNLLNAEDFERAKTWNVEIARELFGPGVPFADQGSDRCWGGLHISRQTGEWYDFRAGAGGVSSPKLVGHIKKLLGESWKHAAAARWVLSYLATHPGTGPIEPVDDEKTKAQKESRADRARRFLEIAEPLTDDCLGSAYLASRGLPGPYPEALRWVPLNHARPGEGALLMPLTAHERTVAILLTHVDGLGKKSTIQPQRYRLNLEPVPGAIMAIAEATPGTVDISTDVVIAEGLENSLSIARVKNPPWRVIGLAGINTLQNVTLHPNEKRVLIFQDSDPLGHPGRAGLATGIDALISAGKTVRKTDEDPQNRDANAILQDPEAGEKELRRLLSKPVSAALSFKRQAEKLAKIPETEYLQARRQQARELGVPVKHLDDEVRKHRPEPTPAEDTSTAGAITVPEEPPWSGPSPGLAPLLDAIAEQIERFVSITSAQLTAIVLWIAAAHLMNGSKLGLELFPHLAIESKDPNSGKSTLLEVVWNCLPRAKLWTYPTGALLARVLDLVHPSICLDELQYATDPNLLRIIDASHKKVHAKVPVLVIDKSGNYVPREFDVWVPMALARLGEFSGAQQSRSIVIWMLPKLPGEVRQRRRSPVIPELTPCRRQLIAWAQAVDKWVDPALPSAALNRDLDNWEPLLFVAEQAGEEWKKRAHAVVEELLKNARRP